MKAIARRQLITTTCFAALFAALLFAFPSALLAAEEENPMVAGERQALEQMPKHEEEVERHRLPMLVLEDGWLKMQFGDLNLKGNSRVKIKGDDADWIAMSIPGDEKRARATLQRIDFKEVDGTGNWMTMVLQTSGILQVHGFGGSRSGYQNATLLFHTAAKGKRSVIFNVTGPNDGNQQGKVICQLNAATLTEMRQNHPEEVRKYIAPLLLAVNGYDMFQPGATDVYRVFKEIPASPEVIAKIEKLLAQLGSPLPEQRIAASKALDDLGSAGILAVLRMDLSNAGPEERSRLDEFLGSQGGRRIADPAVLRRDARFLVECLGDADPAVRLAAKAALVEVKGAPIDFDPAAPEAERKAQVDKLQKQLFPAAKVEKPKE